MAKNFGFAAGNNIGIKKALQRKADLYINSNNDTVVDPKPIHKSIRCVKTADIVSPKIYFASGFEFHKQRYKKSDLGKVIW